MPLDKILPWAQIGGDLLATGANAMLQASNNRQQRAFAREMYSKQRTDSLSDWNMQNFYNSPAETMKRLKSAGLNPNLVYGNGTVQTQAATPRASSAQSANTQAPRIDSPSFMGIYDLQQRKADIDFRQEAIANLRKDREVKDAQILETLSRVPGYAIKQGLDKYQLEWNLSTDPARKGQLAAGIAQTQANTKFTLDQNERAAAMQSYSLQEAAQKVIDLKYKNSHINKATYLNLMQDLKNKETMNLLAREDLKLRKEGIYPGDPVWLRTLVNHLGQLGGPVQKAAEKVKTWWSDKQAKNKFNKTTSPFPWMR